MTHPSNSTFQKYKNRGAYHWNALRRNPRDHDCFTATRYAIMLETAQIRPGELVLDLGCGDGVLLYLASRQMPSGKYVGVEPEEIGRGLGLEMLARRGMTIDLLTTTSEVADESQDVILCSEVIEHVPQPEELLCEIHRMLRPGGRAIISTPVRATEYPNDCEHVREFFPQELIRLVGLFFTVMQSQQYIPLFAVELYHWRPWFFLRRGVIRWTMNILSAWFGIQIMRNLNTLDRYYLMQVVTAVKNETPTSVYPE